MSGKLHADGFAPSDDRLWHFVCFTALVRRPVGEALCPEKANLVRLHTALARAYSGAVIEHNRRLNHRRDTSTWLRVEVARRECEEARKALDDHVKEHGC